MSEVLKITKVFILSAFGLSTMKHQVLKGKKDIWKPIVLLIALISLIPAYLGYITLINNVYIQLYTLGQESALFTLAIVAVSFMILFFGIVYAMSAFYFSKNVEQLIPLPIKESKIVIGKFLSMMVYEYLLILPFLLPVFIVASQDFGGIMYVITVILTVLLLPVIPLGIGTILVMLLMKFTNIQGKKDFIRNISLFLMIVAIIGIQTLMTRVFSNMPIGGEGQYLSELLQQSNGMMELIGKAYPLSIWVSKSLAMSNSISGMIYLILHLAVSILMIYVVGTLGSQIYIKTLLEKSNYKRSNKSVNVKKEIVSRPQYIAIFMNDVRLVLRTPIYLFNCVSIALILPILIVVMPMLSGSGQDINFAQLYLNFGKYFNLILIAFFAFVATVNPTASTTFSREGKSNWITSIIPVPYTQLFIGRILQPLLIQLVSIIFLLVALKFILPLSVLSVLIILFLGLVVSLPIISAGVIIDALNPKLDWDEPQKAVKQNLNVLFNMILGIGYIVLLGFISKLMMDQDSNVFIIYIIISVLSVILTVGCFAFFKKAVKR